MAALAIPIVLLGSIYILSEQEKKASTKNIAVQEKIQKQSRRSLLKNCLWLPRYAKLSTKISSKKLGLEMPIWMDTLKGVK